MTKIYKFTLLHPSWTGILNIQRGAKFVYFDFQHKNPCLWFEVDPDAPLERRAFEVVGTGFELPTGVHLASKQVEDKGMYWVWHLYEQVASPESEG